MKKRRSASTSKTLNRNKLSKNRTTYSSIYSATFVPPVPPDVSVPNAQNIRKGVPPSEVNKITIDETSEPKLSKDQHESKAMHVTDETVGYGPSIPLSQGSHTQFLNGNHELEIDTHKENNGGLIMRKDQRIMYNRINSPMNNDTLKSKGREEKKNSIVKKQKEMQPKTTKKIRPRSASTNGKLTSQNNQAIPVKTSMDSVDLDTYGRVKRSRESIVSSYSGSSDDQVASATLYSSTSRSSSKIPKHSQAYYMQLAHRLMHSHDGIVKQRMAEKKKQEQLESENWFQPNRKRPASTGRIRSSSGSNGRISGRSSISGSIGPANGFQSNRTSLERSTDPNYIPVHERVHSDLLVHSEKIKKLKEKYDKEEQCTFQPTISKKSQEIAEQRKRRSLLEEINEFGEQDFAARPTINSVQYMKEQLKEACERELTKEKPQISKYSEEILKNNPLYQNISFLDRQRYMSMESERVRLENAENARPSFQPVISKKSDLISQYRRKRLSIQSDASKFIGKDDLFGYYKDHESRESIVDPSCTFQPKINEYSKSIAKSHTIDDLINYAKEREERIEKQQKMKEELSLQKCTFKPKLVAKQTEEWLQKSMLRENDSPSIKDKNFLYAKYESEMRSKEDDSECTFRPKINKGVKYDPQKSYGFAPERKQYDSSYKKMKPIVKGLDTFFDRIQRMNEMKLEEEERRRERLNDVSDPVRELGFLSNHRLDQVPDDFSIVGPLMAQRTQKFGNTSVNGYASKVS